jgi:N-acetylglucosaminyldiphosphoundecaprenol N-acetyl-beta-D-mannosaminyltransferase
VYFFGGEEGAAEAAAQAVNRPGSGIVPAGVCYPGFVGIDQMSSDVIIQDINASGADFLVVALGAAKGHRWIEANRHRLEVPVISHLGAAINFISDRVLRAPLWVQQLGLEWLWRILQEPPLFMRYARDAVFLAKVTVGFVLPEALMRRYRRQPTLEVTELQDGSWFGTIEHGFEAATVASLPGGPVAGIELRHVKHLDCVAAGWLFATQYRVSQDANPLKLRCDAVSAATLRHWRVWIQTSG